MEAPLPKEGWLRKLARSGLVKNWQSRYFVLENSKISYFQQQLHAFPYADNLKGELFLLGAKISDDKKKYNEKQVYIISGEGQKDLLIEADSAEEAAQWSEAIQKHINYAPHINNTNNSAVAASIMTRTASDSIHFEGVEEGKSSKNNSYNGADEFSHTNPMHATNERDSNDMDGAQQAANSTANSISITPKPAWVIKVLRTNGEKIFINLCEHAEVPMIPLVLSIGYNKWPLMVLTPPRTIKEEKGEDGNSVEVTIYDAIVNPAVVSICLKDTQAKDATCARVMRLLKKNYGEELQSEFRLPKITKKYKGEISAVMLPANIGALARKRTSIFASFTHGNPRGGSFLRSASTSFNNNSIDNRSPFQEDGSISGENPMRQQSQSQAFDRSDSFVSQPSITGAFHRTTSLNNNSTVSPMHGGGGSSAGKFGRSVSSTAFNEQNISEQERRSTLQRLFPNVHDADAATNRNTIGNTAGAGATGATSSSYGSSTAGAGNPVNISNREITPKLSRTHTEMNYDAAAQARSGNVRKSVRSSLINPLVDKNQLLHSANEAADVARKLVIPFQVVRSNGTVVRQLPDKLSSGKVLGFGVKVFVVARKINFRENTVWMKTTEGWIMDKYSPTIASARTVSASHVPTNANTAANSASNSSNSTGRILVPTLYGTAVSVRIVSTRFEQAGSDVSGSSRQSTSGWNFFRPSAIREGFQTRFVLEVMQLDNAMLRISRTLGEILDLRAALLNFSNKAVKDRAAKAGDFPVEDDNDPELVDDVHLLLELVESVEAWFNKLIALQIERTKCKAFTEFLLPREFPDYELMDLELMAKDGLGGAWGDQNENINNVFKNFE